MSDSSSRDLGIDTARSLARAIDREPAQQPPAEAGARYAKLVRAEELLGPEGVVWIENAGEIYTLRRTRAGRLLLTK